MKTVDFIISIRVGARTSARGNKRRKGSPDRILSSWYSYLSFYSYYHHLDDYLSSNVSCSTRSTADVLLLFPQSFLLMLMMSRTEGHRANRHKAKCDRHCSKEKYVKKFFNVSRHTRAFFLFTMEAPYTCVRPFSLLRLLCVQEFCYPHQKFCRAQHSKRKNGSTEIQFLFYEGKRKLRAQQKKE